MYKVRVDGHVMMSAACERMARCLSSFVYRAQDIFQLYTVVAV